MTVAALPRVVEYIENGVTTVFAVPFQFLDDPSIEVLRRDGAGVETVLALSADYTVSGGDGDTGTVTTVGAALAGRTLVIRGRTIIDQATAYPVGGRFPAESHEKALDRLTMIGQEQADGLSDTTARAILLPAGEVAPILPPASERAGGNKILAPDPTTGTIAILGGGAFKGDPGGNAMAIGLFSIAQGLAIEDGYDRVRTSGWSAIGEGSADYVYDPAVDVAYVTANPTTSFLGTNGRGFRLDAQQLVTANMLGARAQTSSQFAIRDTAALLRSNGGGKMRLAPGTYPIGRVQAGSQRGPSLRKRVPFDAQGAILSVTDNTEFLTLTRLQDRADTTFVSYYGTAQGAGGDYAQLGMFAFIQAGDIRIYVDNSDAFAAGDLCYRRFGQAPYDSAEVYRFDFAYVTVRGGGWLEFDRPVPETMSFISNWGGAVTAESSQMTSVYPFNMTTYMQLTGVGIPANSFVGAIDTVNQTIQIVDGYGNPVNATATAGASTPFSGLVAERQRRIIKMTDIPENISVKNLHMVDPHAGSSNAEAGIFARYARNISLEHVTAYDPGSGLLWVQFCDLVSARNIWVDHSAVQYGQPSKGRILTINEAKAVHIDTWGGEAFEATPVFVEAGSQQVRLTNGMLCNNFYDLDGSGNRVNRSPLRPLIFLGGGRDLLVDGLLLEGNPSNILEASGVADLLPPFLRNVTCTPSFAPSYGAIVRYCDIDHIDETFRTTWFTYRKRRRFTAEVEMVPGASVRAIKLPKGPPAKITLTLSSKVGVTSLAVQRTDYNNPVPSDPSTLPGLMTAGIPFVFPKTNNFPWWIVGAGHPFGDPSWDREIRYTADVSLVRGTMLYVDVEYFPADPASSDDSIGHATNYARFTGSAVYDPPSLASGSSHTTTVNVAGTLPGDIVDVSFSAALSGTFVTGNVDGADVVTVTHANLTGAAVDVSSGTLRVATRRAR